MVSLASAETSYPRLPGPADEAESLRESALWYPEIPERHLHLNETCFTGINTPLSEFRPLCYTLFGGPSVTNLQSLTKVSVVFQQSCMRAIEFFYDTGNIRRLGRPRQRSSTDETSYLLINGAQGEGIKMFEIDLDPYVVDFEYAPSFAKHGKLRSFKVSSCSLGPITLLQAKISEIVTNRGRQKHFRAKRCLSEEPYSLKPMEIVPGTTLTGLYAGWVSEILFNEPGLQFT